MKSTIDIAGPRPITTGDSTFVSLSAIRLTFKIGFLAMTSLCITGWAIAATPTFSILYNYLGGSGGSGGIGSLVHGTDGRLYGFGQGGGPGVYGDVYAINTDGTGFTILHSFTGNGDGGHPTSVIQGKDGRLYGVATIGASYAGAINPNGVLFVVNIDGTGFTAIHTFSGTTETPVGVLMQGSDDRIYGVSYYGGTSGFGDVYAINTDGTGYTVLHNFTGGDGYLPYGGVIQGSDGRLYGVADGGTQYDPGHIFAMNPDGTGFTILYSFTAGSDGAFPVGPLVQGTDGRLYGTNQTGVGGSPFGVLPGNIYAIKTDGTGFTILHSFSAGSDGSGLNCGLIQGTDGRLYGVAVLGGANNYGTVYAVNPDGTGFTVLHAFSGIDGVYPVYALTQLTNGSIVGAAQGGGANGAGTLFEISSLTTPPPAVTSASVSASYGSAFSYTIFATNSPTGYGATDLPSGLALNGNVISGTLPNALGTSIIDLLATNAGGTGTGTLTLTILDPAPPMIARLTPSIALIWPPNKKMVPITLGAGGTNLGRNVTFKITSVTTNEPDGKAQWQITGPLTLNLLADRLGTGTGRIYTITVVATDAAGSSSTRTCTVTVPHDQGR